ncbi:hypothetical protein [Roseovarius sp.]|uniref:hypothetical protein n=1 Tax=Roseovarius sp. TaxID=1486281 RepID=UPI00356A0C86
MSAETPPEGLWCVANHPREWIRRVQGTETRYYQAIGLAEALMLKAADLGQQHRQWSSCGLRDTRKKRVRNIDTPIQSHFGANILRS